MGITVVELVEIVWATGRLRGRNRRAGRKSTGVPTVGEPAEDYPSGKV